MISNRFPIFSALLLQQRRSLMLWGLALAAIAVMYISFYPSLGESYSGFVDDLPEGLVTALRYDTIGTAPGWITSTVYGLLGAVLLLVFAIGSGARLLAGEEESGTLELEATSPVPRRRILAERLGALTAIIAVLVMVLTLTTWIMVTALNMDVSFTAILAASVGLFLLILGFGSIAFAIGAATGNRALAIASAAALATVAYMFNALGPVVEVGWMSSVSPFNWYLGNDPLANGFDWVGLTKLVSTPLLAATAATFTFPRRDLNI